MDYAFHFKAKKKVHQEYEEHSGEKISDFEIKLQTLEHIKVMITSFIEF